jgi:tetratricopeptide (TPR) repeat protein
MTSATAAVTVTADQKQSEGVRLYEEGRYEEAFVVLAAALRQSEDTPWHLWNDWSAAAFACNQMEKAEAGLKHALALNEKSVEVRANLGGLLLKLGRTTEAIPCLEVAATQSTGLHRIAIQQLLATCRQKESSAQSPEAVPENGNRSSPSAGVAPIAAAPEPERHWFPDISGWFREDEAMHLFTAIQLARPAKILEIGTFYGRSTATICSAIKALQRPIEFTTCDLDFRSEEEFAQVSESIS